MHVHVHLIPRYASDVLDRLAGFGMSSPAEGGIRCPAERDNVGINSVDCLAALRLNKMKRHHFPR
jgi:diadenosine tetraphosphate (Ap4A) HIT family hydrolase